MSDCCKCHPTEKVKEPFLFSRWPIVWFIGLIFVTGGYSMLVWALCVALDCLVMALTPVFKALMWVARWLFMIPTPQVREN